MKKIISIILIFCLLSIPIHYILAANTHSTDLEKDNSQYWSITNGDQTGLGITDTITIAGWVKAETLVAGVDIVAKWADAGDEKSYVFYVPTAGSLAFFYTKNGQGGASNTSYATTDGNHITIGSWVHVAVSAIANGTTIVFYVNGSVVDSTIGRSNAIVFNSGTDPFLIGHADNNFNYWDGLLDEFAVWSRILNSGEVAEIYNSGDGLEFSDYDAGLLASLQGYWKFDNDGLDQTANNNDLTNNNSATFSTDVPFPGSPVESSGGGEAMLMGMPF